ncbi:MAG: hypothetical protein HY719_11615, partial [Planctomycetes bacterium]|nr:hypothetical protein [Planctomycetota bacterium]
MFSFPLIRRADLIVLLAALAMPAVGAAAERSWDRDDDDVIRATWAAYDAEERGDDEAAFDRLLAVLRQHPDSPASELLVQRLSDLARTVDQHATLRGACEALLAAGVRNGEMEDWLRSRVADLLRRAGRPVDARAVAASRGFIDDWMVIGPFGESGRAVYDEPFPPESEIDLDKTYPQRRHTASWTRLLVFEPGQSIAPGRFVKRGTGAFYALAQVRVAANTPAALRLSTSTAAKVWMNGEMALGVDPFRHRIPSEHVAPATLRAGWNRVLVKVCSGRGAAFQLRLTDPDGRPIPGATVEREPSLHPAQAAAPAKSPAPAADVYPGAFWRYTRRADGPGEKSAWGHVAAAMCFDREGFTDDALHHAEIAASMLPGDAAALCFLADHERDARDLPATHRVALAREHFRKALEIDPKNVYARLALIRFDIQDKKEKEGVEQLRALSAEFPASWLIHDVIGDVCGGQGWEQEERDEREAVLRLHPEHEGTLEFWANYYARRDHFRDRALPLLRKLHQINRANRSIALHLAGIAEERGRLEDALAIVNVIADEEPSFQERAIEMRVRMLRALHRLDEAVAELEVLRARYSYRDEYPRRIGDLRYEQGRVPGALASWRAALAINPGLHELRRLIDHVEALGRGEDPLALERENDFARPFLRDVQQAIASAPDAKDYPKALAALLIDQAVLRIYPNGTSSETVTAVRKIFNDAGREAFSQVGGGGELLEARTHAADGKVYEPNNIGHGAFEMPEVKPGCVIEHCYRMERSYEPDEGFNHGG